MFVRLIYSLFITTQCEIQISDMKGLTTPHELSNIYVFIANKLIRAKYHACWFLHIDFLIRLWKFEYILFSLNFINCYLQSGIEIDQYLIATMTKTVCITYMTQNCLITETKELNCRLRINVCYRFLIPYFIIADIFDFLYKKAIQPTWDHTRIKIKASLKSYFFASIQGEHREIWGPRANLTFEALVIFYRQRYVLFRDWFSYSQTLRRISKVISFGFECLYNIFNMYSVVK